MDRQQDEHRSEELDLLMFRRRPKFQASCHNMLTAFPEPKFFLAYGLINWSRHQMHNSGKRGVSCYRCYDEIRTSRRNGNHAARGWTLLTIWQICAILHTERRWRFPLGAGMACEGNCNNAFSLKLARISSWKQILTTEPSSIFVYNWAAFITCLNLLLETVSSKGMSWPNCRLSWR
jgi:hypothetical protein